MSTFIQLHPLFSDGMVLQRRQEVPVWGTGKDGLSVAVDCNGIRVETVVEQGQWRVKLPPAEAGGPFLLTVQAGSEEILIRDVYFGEVWLAGGQSNMEFNLKDSLGGTEEAKSASNAWIRYFHVPHIAYFDNPTKWAEHPEWKQAEWKACTPEHAPYFSAVAYYFAKELQEHVNVPIGIVNCNWGGTSASCWMDENALKSDPELREYVDEYDEICTNLSFEKYLELEAEYNAEVAAHLKRKEELPEHADPAEAGAYPWPPPHGPGSFLRYSGLYETMLSKVVPYGLKGFIYYQGESDAGKGHMYEKLLTRMVENWRNDWGNQDLWFLNVQLPAWSVDDKPEDESWPLVREAQLQVSRKLHHSAMAVILDCGDYSDIHPINKKPVGERLSLLARNLVYGQPVEYRGPELQKAKADNGKAVLTFDHAGEGLRTLDGPVQGFRLAGSDGVFVPADAVIQGNNVIVSSDGVADPKAVSYGWASWTTANLISSYGLLASPFQTSLSFE